MAVEPAWAIIMSDQDDQDEEDYNEREDWGGEEQDDYLIDGVGFQDENGVSSLRAATENNPRDRPCPQCGTADVLTRIDERQHYVCDRCAERAEGYGG